MFGAPRRQIIKLWCMIYSLRGACIHEAPYDQWIYKRTMYIEQCAVQYDITGQLAETPRLSSTALLLNIR